jgi:hypothetical protein
MTWQAANPSIVRVIGSGDTASVAGLSPGITNVTVTYAIGCCTATDTIEIIAYRVVVEHPSGDPVTAPAATNEFTYSRANPGVLSINCRARVEPNHADARAEADRRARWSIDAVGNSALAWTVPDPADATRGRGLNTTANFTGLPSRHDDFGHKDVRFTLEGSSASAITLPIEVFWPKTATNHPPSGLAHPGGTAPNWFYYWRQVIGEGHMEHVRYGGAGAPGEYGRVPAMTNWNYVGALNKRRIILYDRAATTIAHQPCIGIGPFTGIDLFRNAFLHEREHVNQIARADAVVGAGAGTCWLNGWAWLGPSNRWRLGPGRVAGAATGICPPGGPGTLGAAGSGDVQLDIQFNRWPDAWGAPPPAPPGGYCQGHPIEHQAYQRMTGAEHALARWDWGDPGKNHRTLRRWND